MNWPNALVTELASRRCIVFLGAGASAGCVSSIGNEVSSPPTWRDFLRDLMSRMKSTSNHSIINGYIEKDRFLEAAELIKNEIDGGIGLNVFGIILKLRDMSHLMFIRVY